MIESRTDSWIEGQPDVWQPKRDIADYVESSGFAVPRRFETLEDALGVVAAGGSIIVRSEHPDEYNGPSGLSDSYVISLASIEHGKELQKIIDRPIDIDSAIRNSEYGFLMAGLDDLQAGILGIGDIESLIMCKVLEDPGESLQRFYALLRKNPEFWRYTKYTNQNYLQALSKASFSFWEYIEGENVTVVADDAVDGRYHTFFSPDSLSPYGAIVDASGNVVKGKKAGQVVGEKAKKETERLLRTYEEIRNLNRFDPAHCPIIEFQLDNDGKLWFLQSHRSRDFRPSVDSIDRSEYTMSEGWLEADAVRGSTHGLLTGMQAALKYTKNYGRGTIPVPDNEDACFGSILDHALSEVMSRRRTAFISARTHEHLYQDYPVQHEGRSKWFKSMVGISLGRDVVTDEIKKSIRKSVQEGVMARAVLDIVSDGKIGFVRLSPNYDQPIQTEY